MVSNSLSRRRHMIAAPEICKKPPPPPLPPYPPGGCWCTVGALWVPAPKTINVGLSPYLPELPNGDPVEAWIHSTPELAWSNPYNLGNHTTITWNDFAVPPGTPWVAINVGYVFSNERHCSGHYVIDTPGA